jgi:hypothetical protein
VAQVVEPIPSKWETLSSNPTTSGKRKKKQKEEEYTPKNI